MLNADKLCIEADPLGATSAVVETGFAVAGIDRPTVAISLATRCSPSTGARRTATQILGPAASDRAGGPMENACARHPEAGAFADAHAPTLAPSASNAQHQRKWDASQNGLSLHPTTKTPGPGSGRGLLRLPEHRGGAGELAVPG
ncbi:hypothetical protein CKAH01_15066 [Colletotrichum kahawae]|uniref:Uncharacterized protein n=1 Tax=Colletotrichum kahawae TaxID=34407 RepID=A0AAD9YJ86_COLKA|nr:hypothetical protein CKAH01_15066 [Colletotrichum kahawae]